MTSFSEVTQVVVYIGAGMAVALIFAAVWLLASLMVSERRAASVVKTVKPLKRRPPDDEPISFF